MGAVYTAELVLRVKDEELLVKRTMNYILREKKRATFPEKAEFRTELDDILKAIFTDKLTRVSDEELYADFSASYGWESVITGWFFMAAKALHENSRLVLWVDNDYDELVVQNGEAVWVH